MRKEKPYQFSMDFRERMPRKSADQIAVEKILMDEMESAPRKEEVWREPQRVKMRNDKALRKLESDFRRTKLKR